MVPGKDLGLKISKTPTSGNNTEYLVTTYVDVEGRSAQLDCSACRLAVVV